MRIEFRQFAFLGEDSEIAAVASECAAQQGLFWEFHDTVFGEWGSESFGTANSRRIAASVGADPDVFNKCLDIARVQEYIDSDIELGLSMGVDSTPTTFINGRLLRGLSDLETYVQIIEQELGNAPRTNDGGSGLVDTGCLAVEGAEDCETE